MNRHLGRSYHLFMAVALGFAAVSCQPFWGIEPIELMDSASSGSTAGSGSTGGPLPCSSLSPPPVFVYGSDSVAPILRLVGPALARSGNATVVYQQDRSCNAIDAIFEPQKQKKTGIGCYFPDGGGSVSEDCKDIGGQECTLDPGLPVDIGVSDIFPETCGRDSKAHPDEIGHRPGPVQAAIFVTTTKSSQEVISWEAARATFDPASKGMGTPWDDEAFVFQRITQSGTQRLMATLLGLDPNTLMRGRSIESSSALIDQIRRLDGSMDEDRALGIYDVVNSDLRTRNAVRGFKALAFQPKGQTGGWKPDVSAYDKANVRNGKYVIWSPLHFVWRKNNKGKIDTVLDLILMEGNLPDVKRADVFATWVTRGFVPDCAMAWSRDTEMGPLTPKDPPWCTCAFEQTLMLEAQPGCAPCNKDKSNCAPGFTCNQIYEFCEPNN